MSTMAQGNPLRRIVSVVALVVIAFAGVGCQNELQAERDALYQQNLELEDQLAAARQARQACEEERDRLLNRVQTLQQELEEAESAEPAAAATGFEGMGLDVERGARGEVIVRVPGDVLFPSGSAELKSSARQTLDEIAGVLRSRYSGNTVRLEGYTDSDPIRKSDWTDNLELSAHRAMAVERYLAEKGLDETRMYSAGFGEANPVASNATPQGKAQNRRVEVVVLMQ